MQNKIIEKFLAILFSNELNTITGYDNCYIMADILISCSKLNLQEKSNYLLKKILKNLRIEKLKRSENEINIISTLYALINLLIRNKFFIMKEKNKFNNILNEIFQEVNYYINTDTENYELRVFLEYFYIFMIFYESQNYSQFCNKLLLYILGSDDQKNINNNKDNNFSIKNNFELVSKIKALSYLFEDEIIVFDNIEDKIEILSLIKKILFSPICYLRGDCRFIMEAIFTKFFKQEISSEEDTNTEKNIFKKLSFPPNYSKFLEKINKNYLNFSSKSYADDDWLYGFINEERASMESEDEENADQDEMSNDTHKLGSINGINSAQIKKYRQKYKDDEYALNSLEVDLNKEFNDILLDILDKLLNHPLSEPFSYELNEETLGDLYEQYMEMIPNPIDLDTIQKKVMKNGYDNFISFNNDINLMFKNCKTFNEKGSKLYMIGIHLEEYYKLIISPIKKNRLINKNYNSNNNTNININNNNGNNFKISFNINDNTSAINEQSDIKKVIITNKSYNNSINESNNEVSNFNSNINNDNSNNKFQIPLDIFNSNHKDNDNNLDYNDKSEGISKAKVGKKGKNHKKKKANNNSNNNIKSFTISLDEKDEI